VDFSRNLFSTLISIIPFFVLASRLPLITLLINSVGVINTCFVFGQGIGRGKMQSLFDDSDSAPEPQLKVNKSFARDYERKKRVEETQICAPC
jgi:hypothetical protein